jgi:hypothetical protein
MTRIYSKFDPEDFQARIRFFPLEEGGRRPYPNGIRFDFKYAEDDNNLYMIHPDFFDASGNSFSTADMLPLGVWLAARMYIVVPEMREKVHRLKIKEDLKFFCMDGSRQVAEGVVSKIVGLYGTSA